MTPDPSVSSLVPISELNRLPLDRFGSALEPLFEAAGPLADVLGRRRPFGSYEELLERAGQVVQNLSEAQRVRLLNAHPRIGAPPEALRTEAPLSYREQGYDRDAEEAAEQREVQRRLAELNRAYEHRFGFRFVVFVNRRPRSAIVEVLERRLRNSREDELRTALGDLLAIARDRLRTLRG